MFFKMSFKTGLLDYRLPTMNYSPIIKILTLQSPIKINEIKIFYFKHQLSKTTCLTQNTFLIFFTMFLCKYMFIVIETIVNIEHED